MKFGLFFPLTMAVAMAGCTSYNQQQYHPIDRSEKTITVPPGSNGLTGKVKQVLADDGWKMAVRRGPRVTEGTVGERTRIEQYDTFKTRYELLVQRSQFDFCLGTLSPALDYNISMFDNSSGEEVMAFGGQGCEAVITSKFKDAITGVKRD